jgi:hypothetical protein
LHDPRAKERGSLAIDKQPQKNNPDKWKETLANNQENLVNFITKSHAAKFEYVLTHNWNAIYKGFSRDIKKLLSPGEFKKVFLNTHG